MIMSANFPTILVKNYSTEDLHSREERNERILITPNGMSKHPVPCFQRFSIELHGRKTGKSRSFAPEKKQERSKKKEKGKKMPTR